MFLSKVWIDWHWAKDPYQLHRALWHAFPNRPDDERDFLFRVESLEQGRGAQVLLQSAMAPQGGEVASVVATKAVSYPLEQGMRLRFKLRGNPIKSIKDPQQRLNKKGEVKACRVPLIHEDEQLHWLTRKLESAAELQTARAIKEAPLYFRKAQIGGKIQPVCFEGILAVTNSKALHDLLQSGIGPAKAMGCGLLSLAPA
ncbi:MULTISPECIES: type I-E CRISPR-associated protein Cas6/Cse3/CasE [Gammaproteobacteria]|uniref:type I-E CRISPR-associated protein Cas6/Cse3/CasE n=1 Tax=Gammaproteobacteria TaxID=1236 RepID=UPI003A8FD1E5